jgi:hypothetical protein
MIDSANATANAGGAPLDPEELQHIHEVIDSDGEIPHEDDEASASSELSREEVKSHIDDGVEDEANSSLYKGQHLPE